MSEQEKRLLEILKDGPLVVDDLIDRAALGAAAVNSGLTMLEIKGHIRRLPGKKIALSGKS